MKEQYNLNMRLLISIAIITIASVKRLDCADGPIVNPRLNFFDIDLFRYMAENKQGNVLVSPASIKSILAMLLEGAIGDTANEIKAAMRLPPTKQDYWKELNAYLDALQTNTTGTDLENANIIFVNKNLKLMEAYEMYFRYVYLADVVKIDFGNSNAATKQINNWVANKTKGLIPSIVEPSNVESNTEMMVTNALYFKSTWEHSFNPRFTRGACFFRHGVCRNVAMMDLRAELNYAYVENLRAHAIELPYKGKRYSMILLIPRDHDNSEALIRDLPYMSISQIYEIMEPENVQLSMPKFTIDYSEDMVEALKSMRITSLFTPSANLSAMFEGVSPYVSNILHRVHLSVDEIGTVAAAASTAMVIPLINDSVQVKVDKPYLIFIRDNVNGLILFEGRIEEPTEFTNAK